MRANAAPDTQALRGWQRRALVRYLAAKPRDFLAVATPGSGKTAFALRVAGELLADGTVEQITVVVPTEHLKTQWALAAAGVGIALDPKFRNSAAHTSSEYHGVVVTYAQVASHPTRHRVRTENRRTLVVFDEIHHGGDAKSWGDAIREAFDDATRRLALTGTPFRSDDSRDPVRHLRARRRRPAALAGRPHLRLRRGAGRRRGPAGGLPGLLGRGAMARQRGRGTRGPPRRAAERRADRPRVAHRAEPGRRVDPRGAAGRRHPAHPAARRRRARRGRHGHRLRPDRRPRLRGRADQADRSRRRRWCSPTTPAPRRASPSSPRERAAWLVAVRMVSEGVDVPRLAVGVYATSASTPLFFAQAIGRFVRSRRPGETASIFLPSVPTCCCWPARWRPSATTCSASRTASRRRRRAVERRTVRAQRRGQRLRIAGRRRRAGSGDLRRLVVRHRDAGGQRRGGRLPRHPRPARRRRRCETCCGAGKKSSLTRSRAAATSTSTATVVRGRRRMGSCASCAAN